MKALSLWQPWASLMAAGVKTSETRSWGTNYRGPLVICAAKRRHQGELYAMASGRLGVEWRRALRRLAADLIHSDADDTAVADALYRRQPYGQALAIVELLNCRATTGTANEPKGQQPFGDFGVGRVAWDCKLMEALDPAPCIVGRQGLFNLELVRP